MIRVRKASERGHFDHGWLDTHHTFSFSRYYDPPAHGLPGPAGHQRGPGGPAAGFGTHPHEDMDVTIKLD